MIPAIIGFAACLFIVGAVLLWSSYDDDDWWNGHT